VAEKETMLETLRLPETCKVDLAEEEVERVDDEGMMARIHDFWNEGPCSCLERGFMLVLPPLYVCCCIPIEYRIWTRGSSFGDFQCFAYVWEWVVIVYCPFV
jgi:hypothetical protein